MYKLYRLFMQLSTISCNSTALTVDERRVFYIISLMLLASALNCFKSYSNDLASENRTKAIFDRNLQDTRVLKTKTVIALTKLLSFANTRSKLGVEVHKQETNPATDDTDS
jgi:hypothetical protein